MVREQTVAIREEAVIAKEKMMLVAASSSSMRDRKSTSKLKVMGNFIYGIL